MLHLHSKSFDPHFYSLNLFSYYADYIETNSPHNAFKGLMVIVELHAAQDSPPQFILLPGNLVKLKIHINCSLNTLGRCLDAWLVDSGCNQMLPFPLK